MDYNNLRTKEIAMLKEKINETFKDKQVSMWGVPISPGSPKSDVILSKFIRNREDGFHFHLGHSLNMFRRCLSWRHKIGADSILEEDLGFKELEGVVSYINGVDKQGRPIWWENNYGIFKNEEIYNKFLGDKKKLEKFIRWKIQVLERGIKMLDFKPNGTKSITMVYNVKGMTFKEHKFFSKHIFPILNNYYPGIIELKIFLDAPWWYTLLIDQPIINFVFPKKDNVCRTLYKYIKPEYIPIQYNGLRRPNELEDGVVKPATEFTVDGGKVTNVTFEGIEEGATITWDVVVVGWDLTYSVQFIPDAVENYGVMVEKPRKMFSMDEALRNSYVAKESGKLVLTIDNTGSRKKKVGACRYLVQNKMKYDDESYENNCLFSTS